jgi:cell shape-determining protein MreD
VGGNDGGKGLPVVNWSREHGDLRIAHFLGMHTLQLFPLFGFFVARTSRTVIIFASLYVALVTAVLVEALMGLPLI